jgi:hypothetical protein
MAIYTVRKGQRYRATIGLGWLQSVASNEAVAAKFREVGFAEVTVWGSGRRRMGTALWPKEDASAEIPDEIIDIQIEV